jgi:MoaA/NifB/PqqE/SkfB family radical SAM enzyme
MKGIFRAWGKILTGYQPNLSIEITRECPLTCPGCYAYGADHLGGDVTLRELQDFKGQELVDAMFTLLDKHKPLHVSIVGGEPLVRYRELSEILPRMSARGIHTQVVTSAVRQIPLEWVSLKNVQIVVSIDGLQPEHDERRKPATYDRILKHIEGHHITVHCTVTRQQVRREGYLEEFVKIWSANPNIAQLWISLYTPQVGEISAERLTKADRQKVVEDLTVLRAKYPKLKMPKGLIQSYVLPPHSPEECVFAKTTACVSSNFEKPITPCQFGGNPDCANCGCIASAGLAAVGRHILPGGMRVGAIFDTSFAIGAQVKAVRDAVANGRPDLISARPQ